MRRIVVSLVGLMAVIALVVALASSSPSGPTSMSTGATARVYSDDVLSRAASMTQKMSVPGPITGHEYHGHINDEQLRLSQTDPEFVRELEAYMQQIDRMLARTP